LETWISASAPDPPPRLVGTSGRFVMSYSSATDWMNRAIWSAPPPGPAMIVKSIGRRGSQSCASDGSGDKAIKRRAAGLQQVPLGNRHVFSSLFKTPWPALSSRVPPPQPRGG
jgi:hypothetical protein